MTYEEFANETVKFAIKKIYHFSHFDLDDNSSIILDKIKDEDWIKSVFDEMYEFSDSFRFMLGEDLKILFEKAKNEEELKSLIQVTGSMMVKFVYMKISELRYDR